MYVTSCSTIFGNMDCPAASNSRSSSSSNTSTCLTFFAFFDCDFLLLPDYKKSRVSLSINIFKSKTKTAMINLHQRFVLLECLYVVPSCDRWVQIVWHILHRRSHKYALNYDLVVYDFPCVLELHTTIQMDDCILCMWMVLCGYSYGQTIEPKF